MSDNMERTGASEAALIADLVATFPGIHARPLREFGAAGFDQGVWTGGEALMPDGLPIFSPLMQGEDTHDGGVHTGFTAWLEARGWYLENYDGGTYMIVPLPAGEQA
jgi:hypothetical protein